MTGVQYAREIIQGLYEIASGTSVASRLRLGLGAAVDAERLEFRTRQGAGGVARMHDD